MNEALQIHLRDQSLAALEEFEEANQRFIRGLRWSRKICFYGFAISVSRFLIDEKYAGLRVVICAATMAFVFFSLARMIKHMRQLREVNRLEKGLDALLERRNALVDARLAEIARREAEGEGWKEVKR